MSPYATYIVETFVTLLVVCGLAFVVLYGARRLGVGKPRGPLSLVGHLPIDARRAIYLVRVGKQVLVVGASEGGLTRLGELPSSEVPDQAAPVSTSFADVLARIGARPAHHADSESEKERAS